MSQVIVVGYQEYSFARSLVVGRIEFLDFCLDLEGVEALVFTSKNAVLSLEKNSKQHLKMQNWKTIPSYAVGAKTAQEISRLGGRVVYAHLDSHADTFIPVLQRRLQNQSICYLRAERIVSNLDTLLLSAGLKVKSQIAYRSVFNPLAQELVPQDGAKLLFTSPSSYQFFLQNFSWKMSYCAIAIGRTTYASFQEGIQKQISPFQNILKSVHFFEDSW